jgi:hypothetical protein
MLGFVMPGESWILEAWNMPGFMEPGKGLDL